MERIGHIISHCWRCENVLSKSNSSLEHILLNSCGGKLKSRNLLCATCNKKLGESCDAVLANQLNLISLLFNVKKEGGAKQPKFKGLVDPDGIHYRLIPGKKLMPELEKPIIHIERVGQDVNFSITVRTMDEFIDKVIELKVEFPDLDIIEILRDARETNEFVGKQMEFGTDIGGIATCKSILKTAINYYIYSGGSREVIAHLIHFSHDEEPINCVWFHYPEKTPLSQPERSRCHNIYLKGSKQTGLLYCYVEYFDTYSFLVKLSTDYRGEDLLKSYSYDVVSNKEVPTKINSDLSRVELERIFFEVATPTQLRERLDVTMELAYEIQKEAKRELDLTKIAVKYLIDVIDQLPEHKEFANQNLLKVIAMIKNQIREKMRQSPN